MFVEFCERKLRFHDATFYLIFRHEYLFVTVIHKGVRSKPRRNHKVSSTLGNWEKSKESKDAEVEGRELIEFARS